MGQFHAAFFCASQVSTIGTMSENSHSRSVTTAAGAASSGRGQLRKVITHSARAAILLVTIGMADAAWAGPRVYDLNILLAQPYPFASAAPSAVSPSTPAPVERVREPPSAPRSSPSRGPHNYRFRLRLIPWLTQVTGEVSKDSGGGPSPSVDFHDDLGLDDYEFQPTGSANLRLGRHDIWVEALVIDMSASNLAERSFTFGALSVAASRQVRTEVELERYDIRYGYSFFDFDEGGFRLGPTVGLGYLDFDVTITDEMSGDSGTIAEKFPFPRVGVHGEMPFGNFLVEADVAGLYIDYDDYEGYAVDAYLSVAWRPYRYFGLVGGYRVLAVDIDDRDNNYDVTFHGPFLGLEARF